VAFSMSTNNRAPMSEINVTPLVDVMLVLLIIFMVTAPMMQEGLSVNLPQAKGSPLDTKEETEKVVITVSAQAKILVNDVEVTEEGLPERIVQATRGKPDVEVSLRADQGVQYGLVVRIVAALTRAGVAKLGMLTAPQEQAPAR
jgi:biopolymer transport protein TolR